MSEEQACVWAWQPLLELGNQVGFVGCPKELADKLIAADQAQDPKVGVTNFRAIVHSVPERKEDAAAYETKVMKPAKSKEG